MNMERVTVLVTEDEDEIRELLVKVFESVGFIVFKASDGQEALELVHLHRDRIDLLVTDLGLPKLGGLELIEQSRAIIPSLKVIAASGFGHANVRSQLHEIGVEDFFPKPFSPLELLETAKRILNLP
jgi:two-component system, cell cycle sensor histidine kinase and response regulator CckA